jgi:hypothetical protein
MAQRFLGLPGPWLGFEKQSTRESAMIRTGNSPRFFQKTLLGAACAACWLVVSAQAEEVVVADIPAAWAGQQAASSSPESDPAGAAIPPRYRIDLPSIRTAQKSDAPTLPRGVTEPSPGAEPGKEMRKSYVIPAMEIVGFDFLLNMFDRAYFKGNDFDSNLRSIRRNLNHDWVVDRDAFTVNQFGHPYQGSMYHTFARSAGLNYWESLAYTFAGSAFWEIAGETTPPSWNDQITTGIGGSFVGEALYRMANLLLEKGGGLSPGLRELGAAAISPATGFNRYAFGDRFDKIFDSHDPAYYARLGLGYVGTTRNDAGASAGLKRNELQADFAMDYGLPGKGGYHYTRPFDYFTFHATASTANGFENVLTRGLLIGRDYEAGQRYRGVWGLFGSYDYISPQTFRVSATGLSLGNVGEWQASRTLAVQSTMMLGVGYTAVGTLKGVPSERETHYGVAPQALLGLRVIFADKLSFDATAREYFVSRVAATDRGGHDNIARADLALTYRIHKQHAVAIKYLWNRRDASYPDLGDRTQVRGTVGIFYTLLGHDRFGANEWW